jgi:5-formyltetrahydrofolate cyclo-ligase
LNKNQVLAVTSSGNKDSVRKLAIQKRSALTFDFIEDSSKIIADKLLSNFIFKNQNTHLFYPIQSKKEIDTWFLHKRLIEQNCKFYSSVHNIRKDTWDCIEFDPKVNFTETTFKVPIPLKYVESMYSKIDIIIIPLLAFDEKGNRIGYGKGIYDNILFNLNPNCIKIGVSFFEKEKKIISSENHDIKLDYCQTINQLYKFI